MSKKKVYTIIGIIVLLLALSMGLTYAYWLSTRSQTGKNRIATACLELNLTNEQNEINLSSAIPLSDEDGASLTPYTFSVENTCNTSVRYQINLEDLETTTLKDQYVRVIFNNGTGANLTTYQTVETTIEGALSARRLEKGLLDAHSSKNYSLILFLGGEEATTFESMRKTFEAKINVISTIDDDNAQDPEKTNDEVPDDEDPYSISLSSGLTIGSVVSYAPSGTYHWDTEYATSYLPTDAGYTNYDKILDSSAGNDFELNEWKVVDIDTANNKVVLMPSRASKGYVRLNGAQGYNNAVKLLNDACQSLYSDSSKGIVARSVNMEDYKRMMLKYNNYDYDALDNEYVPSYGGSGKNYPVIYGMTKGNDVNNSTTGLGYSEQNELIPRSMGINATVNGQVGTLNHTTNVAPPVKSKVNTYFTDMFGQKYANLYFPYSNSWALIATRRQEELNSWSNFGIYMYGGGMITRSGLFENYSANGVNGYSQGSLVPIIEVDVSQINGNSLDGFSI